MAHLTIEHGRVLAASANCEQDVLPSVRSATRVLDSAPISSMIGLESASAAVGCIGTWAEGFRDASTTMRSVSTKLAETVAIVGRTDANAADLYRGIQPVIDGFAVIHVD